MIKNKLQLAKAKTRLVELKAQLNELTVSFTGPELLAYLIPIQNEIKEVKQRVIDYEKLVEGTPIDAVRDMQTLPTPIARVGEMLSKIRIAKKLTQKDVAKKLGWHQPNVARFESENYGAQTVKHIVEFSGALGVHLKVVPYLPIATNHESGLFSSFLRTSLDATFNHDETASFGYLNLRPGQNTSGNIKVSVTKISVVNETSDLEV